MERSNSRSFKIGIACSVGLLLCVVGANWAIARFGMVSVGFGLVAPAGVAFAGLTFLLRDGVQEWGGRWMAVVAIMCGAALSAIISGHALAVASGAAFLASETLDLAVYSSLRRRSAVAAVALSNTVGSVIDSALFLWLAFGSVAHLAGLVIGKLWPTLAVLVVICAIRRFKHPPAISAATGDERG